jgi:endoglucanase
VNPPWPGLLVGGPSQGGEPEPATRWVDNFNDYESNEVAINWNAAMIYAVAAMLP